MGVDRVRLVDRHALPGRRDQQRDVGGHRRGHSGPRIPALPAAGRGDYGLHRWNRNAAHACRGRGAADRTDRRSPSADQKLSKIAIEPSSLWLQAGNGDGISHADGRNLESIGPSAFSIPHIPYHHVNRGSERSNSIARYRAAVICNPCPSVAHLQTYVGPARRACGLLIRGLVPNGARSYVEYNRHVAVHLDTQGLQE